MSWTKALPCIWVPLLHSLKRIDSFDGRTLFLCPMSSSISSFSVSPSIYYFEKITVLVHAYISSYHIISCRANIALASSSLYSYGESLYSSNAYTHILTNLALVDLSMAHVVLDLDRVKILNVLKYANSNHIYLINMLENSNSNSTYLLNGLLDPTRITYLIK